MLGGYLAETENGVGQIEQFRAIFAGAIWDARSGLNVKKPPVFPRVSHLCRGEDLNLHTLASTRT